MVLNSVKMSKYRGAYIHIVNFYQEFIVVVFYKGEFYQFKSATDKGGEYTNEEYILVLDAIRKDAERFIDAIKKERSVIFRLKRWLKNYQKK